MVDSLHIPTLFEHSLARIGVNGIKRQRVGERSNHAGEGCQDSSGIFAVDPVDPVDSGEPPVVGSTDGTEIVSLRFRTLASPSSWMSQERLVGGRRADQPYPLCSTRRRRSRSGVIHRAMTSTAGRRIASNDR